MLRSLLWSTVLCVTTLSHAAPTPVLKIPMLEHIAAKFFAEGSGRKVLLFTLKNTHEKMPDGSLRLRNEFFNADGSLNLVEDAYLVEGELRRYSIDRKGEEEYSEATIHGARVDFQSRSGKRVKTDDEEMTSNFVLNPTFGPYLHTQWEKLLKGETVNVRYGATEMRETIGFNLSKDDHPTTSIAPGASVVTLRMKPSSIFIAAVVPAMYFTFEREGRKRLLEFHGQALPRLRKDGKFRDVSVEGIYEVIAP